MSQLDLFVATADTDAQLILCAVLSRYRALGIREISFEVDRFPGRDSGMVKNGPETFIQKVRKENCDKLILIWDHDGSGKEAKDPSEVAGNIQKRLNGATWKGRSAAFVLVPELEEWIWHHPDSVATCLEVSMGKLEGLMNEYADRQNKSLDDIRETMPKELFEYAMYQVKRRKPRPRDYRIIAEHANLGMWIDGSESFGGLVQVLREWFPPEKQLPWRHCLEHTLRKTECKNSLLLFRNRSISCKPLFRRRWSSRHRYP